MSEDYFISDGIMISINYDYDDYDYDDDYERRSDRRIDKGIDKDIDKDIDRDMRRRILRKEAIDAISHLSNIGQIQNKILKKLLIDDLESMVHEYGISEKLAIEWVKLAQQPDAISILLKGFVKKLLKTALTVEILNNIESFCDKIYINEDLDVVYDRVAKIQAFVHALADKQLGINYHQSLPTYLMKNILSTARLHLNIVDIKYKDADYLQQIFSRSKAVSDAERNSPRAGYISKGKRYIKNWRVLHLMSLIQYQSAEIGGKIHAVLGINKEQDLEKFKENIIKIYSGEISVGEISEWRQKGRWVRPGAKWEWT